MSYLKKAFNLLTVVLVFLMLFCVSCKECKEDVKNKNAEDAVEKSEEVKVKEEAAPAVKKKIKKAIGEVEAGS